jgi:hypothetical protein
MAGVDLDQSLHHRCLGGPSLHEEQAASGPQVVFSRLQLGLGGTLAVHVCGGNNCIYLMLEHCEQNGTCIDSVSMIPVLTLNVFQTGQSNLISCSAAD